MDRRNGMIHQFYWAEITPADFKAIKDKNGRQKYLDTRRALVFSTEEITEQDIKHICGHPYARNNDNGMLPCSAEEEDELLSKEHGRYFLHWLGKYNILAFVTKHLTIPDTVEMAVETGRAYDSPYYCHFKTLKNGQVVTVKKKLEGKNNIIAEIEEAISWAIIKAPAPPKQVEVMTSPLVNAMLDLADDRALAEIKGFIDGPLGNTLCQQSGSRFASQSVTAVSIIRRTGNMSPMAEVQIDGKHRIIEDGQGYTVELATGLSDATIAGLPKRTLGEVIDAPWAQGLKIRTASRIAAEPDKGKTEHVRLRVERVVEPLVIPIKGKPVQYAVELARVLEKARQADIKFSQGILYAMQKIKAEELIAMIDMCADSDATYVCLDVFGLEGWHIKREYGNVFEIARSPSYNIDELVREFSALDLKKQGGNRALAA